MNLTDRQKDLLRLLVSGHGSGAGEHFILVHSASGYGLTYPGGIALPIDYDDIDFRQLRRERLIDLIPIAANQWRGKPTDLGIAMIRRGFHQRRLMREFEMQCPLLALQAQTAMQDRGEKLEARLSDLIEMGAATIRQYRAQIGRIGGERERGLAKAAHRKKVAAFRRRIISAAEKVATEGVREFGNGLLSSQGRLSVHAVLLRTYAARLVSGLRHWLNSSEIMQTVPLPPWREDSIAQRSIQTCEDMLVKRNEIESDSTTADEAEQGQAPKNGEAPRTWPPIVQEWEALKSTRKFESGEPEQIPEHDFRALVAGHFGIEPEVLTEWHIELAAMDLCRHYELIRIIPSAQPDVDSAATECQNPTPIADAGFWKEREEDFRRHDTGENKMLGATWFSQGEYWTFHAGSGSVSVKSVELFKSAAREAAKGIHSDRGAEAWIDWLNLLRYSKDERTGKFLYAKNCPGSSVISERQRESAIAAGESIPSGYLIEFIRSKGGGVERRLYWDTTTTIVENVLENSANECMKLRSLAPLRADDQETALAPGAIQVNSGAQFEVEKYANEIFRAGLEDRINEYARKQAQALNEASSRHNAAAYLPTLIQCKQERLRAEILILADAWVQAATTYSVALGEWAVIALEKAAVLMAGGVRSALQGELELHAVRTGTRGQTGGPREIHGTLKSVLREAKLRLKTQRIKAERSQTDAAPLGLQSGPRPSKDYQTAFARNVDRLRKECGWSFDDLSKATELDKKLILGHVNDGKGAHPKTLERYAQTFSQKLGRPVPVAELES